MGYKRSTVIILKNNQHQILSQLRDEKPQIADPGCWSFIGGSIELGEKPYDAIIRESREEIEYTPKEVKLIGAFYSRIKNTLCYVYFGRINREVENIKLNEGQRVQYFKPRELLLKKMPLILKKFLRENLEEILSL